MIRTGYLPPANAMLAIHFTIAGFPGVFSAIGRVVRSDLNIVTLMFLKEPAGLGDLLLQLKKREDEQTPLPAASPPSPGAR